MSAGAGTHPTGTHPAGTHPAGTNAAASAAPAGAGTGAGAGSTGGREGGGPGPARHLLSLRELTAAEWHALLESAERLAGPDGRRPLLAGRRAGALLFNPSLRTRMAFEAACHDLGAHATVLEAGRAAWQLEHRPGAVMDGEAAEHVTEAAGVLSRMVDVLGVRAFAGLADAAEDARDGMLAAFARAASVPVLNLESAMDHPHQGLADALTLRRRLGRRARVTITWAPHVRPLPLAVPHAALLAFAREGHDVVLAHPEDYAPDAGVLQAAREASRAAGGSLDVTHDRRAALDGADVVYAKSWGARTHYGDAAAAAAGFARHRDWLLTGADLGAAWFMHCLPVRRNVVVADEVLDGPRSLVLEQAAARVDVQKATLCRALEAGP
jgi:N-acetylornithine carbamoyltransferase